MGELFSSSLKLFDRRFVFVGLIPSLSLIGLVFGLIAAGAPETAPSWQLFQRELSDLKLVHVFLLLLPAVLLSILLQPFQLALIRLLEGYWPDSFGWRKLTDLLGRRHEKERLALQNKLNGSLNVYTYLLEYIEHYSKKHGKSKFVDLDRLVELRRFEVSRFGSRSIRYFPLRAPLLPTRLGNVLLAAEIHAGDSYGIDALVIWPRLYPLLSDRLILILDEQRSRLDSAASFAISFALAALVSVLLLWTHYLWLLLPVGLAMLSWLGYRGAIAAALAYGETIRTAVDLHRFDLLRALHLPLPADEQEEKQLFELISSFLRQGLPTDLCYKHDHPPKTGSVVDANNCSDRLNYGDG